MTAVAILAYIWQRSNRVERSWKLLWYDNSVGIIAFNAFEIGWDFHDTERGDGTFLLISESRYSRNSIGADGFRIGFQLPKDLRVGQSILLRPAAVYRDDFQVVGVETLSRMAAGEFTAFRFESPQVDTLDDSFSTSSATITIKAIEKDTVTIDLELNASFRRMGLFTLDQEFTLSRQ